MVDVARHLFLDPTHSFPAHYEGADASEARREGTGRAWELVAPRGRDRAGKVEVVRPCGEIGETVNRREISREEIDLEVRREALDHLVERPERSAWRQPMEEGHP